MFTVPCSTDRYRAHQDVERWGRAITDNHSGEGRPFQWRHNGDTAQVRTEVEIDLSDSEGKIIEFELDAVPYKKVGAKPGGRKKRITYFYSEAERRDWLADRFLKHGLILGNASIQNQESIIASKDSAFKKPGVRFTGKAMIHDPAKVIHALTHGIGDCKAYGYGMLVIKGDFK
jgi:hypothetical protein